MHKYLHLPDKARLAIFRRKFIFHLEVHFCLLFPWISYTIAYDFTPHRAFPRSTAYFLSTQVTLDRAANRSPKHALEPRYSPPR